MAWIDSLKTLIGSETKKPFVGEALAQARERVQPAIPETMTPPPNFNQEQNAFMPPQQQPVQQEDPVIGAINRHFPEDSAKARAIFTHESQLGKFFQNLEGAPAYGVAQIYLPEWGDKIPGNTEEEKIEWLRDPENNLKFARMIYDDSLERHGDGWLPWESYTTGKYKEFYDGP